MTRGKARAFEVRTFVCTVCGQRFERNLGRTSEVCWMCRRANKGKMQDYPRVAQEGRCPPQSVLTEESWDLLAIRQKEIVELRRQGLKYREIGQLYGLSRQRVHQIIQAVER
jgi:DNA-binding NarL/FixJ family response regulator